METTNLPLLTLHDVAVAYNGHPVLHGVIFSLQRGEIGCFLGPSGCGKTTLLRAIAGFEPIVAGRITLNGAEVATPHRQLPPEKRRIGMVFQDYALFPHLTVAQNIAFGLRSKSEGRRKRVSHMLDLVGLADYAQSYPHQLSGGQQQRVALARALAPSPDILLMDEPFSNLDPALREKLAWDVRDILKREGTTAILVTHDQQEAFALADTIGILNAGEIQQWGSAYQIYHAPRNSFVAEFIGQGVLLEGHLLEEGRVQCDLGIVPARVQGSARPGATVRVLIRADQLALDPDGELRAVITGRTFRGSTLLYLLQLPSGAQVPVVANHDAEHAVCEEVRLRLIHTETCAYPLP